MKRIYISEFNNNIKVYYTNEKIHLPQAYSNAVESHWNLLLKSGKKFFRGDVYSITDIVHSEEGINIFVGLTDYAHFLYTIHKNTYVEHDCRVIHTSVLIETEDRKFVLGEMNVGTAFPHKLQFIGGGIDQNDIKENIFDLKHNIKKEILEEVFIDVEDKSMVKGVSPCFLKSGGDNNFLSAIFKMDLLVDENQLNDLFNTYKKEIIRKGDIPEINSLKFIQANKIAVEEFINNNISEKDSNIIPTLKVAVGIDSVEDFYI
jgi:hypothetical protein